MRKFIYIFLFFVVYSCANVITKCKVNEIKIEERKSLYFKYFTGVNETYIIIASNKKKYNSIKDFDGIVYNDEAIFYSISNDTLKIYHRSDFKADKELRTAIVVKNILISNAEFYNLWDNYKTKGLLKFPSGQN